jgi:hypothetical protein
MSARAQTICAIPIQIPVHRIRVTARCLATGGPVHTAALRLADYWGESPEEIAEVLGLQIPRTEQLLADLERGGEPIERDFVLWVDHARGNVLPYSALSGVAVRPSRYGPFTLPVDPPTPQRLQHMGLDAGLSWDLGLEGHVEVLELLDARADIRNNKALPHVLRLPDTQLVIAERKPRPDTEHNTTDTETTGTGPPRYKFSVAQHGTIDPRLTGWARNLYTDDLQKLVQSSQLATTTVTAADTTAATQANRQDPADLASHGRWETLEPHPGILREQVGEAAEQAEERLILAAPDLRHIPTWLKETLSDAHDRDVQIVLCPAKDDLIPNKAPFQFTTSPAPSRRAQPMTLLADDAYAIVHSDPDAILDRRAEPTRPRLHATHHDGAIGAVLDRLHLKRLRPRAPRHKPTPQTISTLLRQALAELQIELPNAVTAQIQPADEQFAIETIARQQNPEHPTSAARKTAAGIAWERALTTLAQHLAAEHEQLHLLAERWKPNDARIDLDLIVADDTKHTVWVIDAKNAAPTNDQLHKMRAQLRLLNQAPDLTQGRPALSVIVHRKRQLDPPLQPTEYPDILRATAQRRPGLLLAKRLPGERPSLRLDRS